MVTNTVQTKKEFFIIDYNHYKLKEFLCKKCGNRGDFICILCNDITCRSCWNEKEGSCKECIPISLILN